MKSIKYLSILLAIILSGSLQAEAIGTYPGDDDVIDTTNYIVYTGKVVDAEDNTPLPFATVESEGENIATVTNIEGNFTLKAPRNMQINTIKISYVGYKNAFESAQKFRNLNNN